MTEEGEAKLLELMETIAFNLGAIASNQSKLVQLAAHQQGISLKAWDPSVEDWPKGPGHNEDISLLTRPIYVGITPEHRAKPGRKLP